MINPLKIILRKLNSCNYHLKQYFIKCRIKILKTTLFTKMLVFYKLLNSKQKVAIGTLFNTKGGVANHILALNKYLKTSNIAIPYQYFFHKIDIETFCRLCETFNMVNNPVIHSHADTWFMNYCHQQQKTNKTKWVHTYHLPYFEGCHGPLENWQIEMNNTLLNVACKADVKIVVGKWLKEYLFEEYKIETIYIPNGVDLDKCNKADKNRFIDLYQLENFILFASKIDYVKNPLEFVELAELLPDEQFVMIGSDITIKVLEQQLHRKVPANLIVIGEYLKHEIILDAMAACKVFVMTSRIEGLPTALMEAMALEKPVVAAKVHGCEELIEDDRYGYLYSLGDVKQLKEKTILAMNDLEIGIKAKQNIIKNYDWKVVAPQIDNIYKDLIK